jgi:hypothetical protein
MISGKTAARAAIVAALLTSSSAFAETRYGADVGATGGWASNPYGSTLGQTSAATLTGSFSPTVTINSPTGSTELRGSLVHTEYSRLYGGTTDYGASARLQRQISPLTSLTGGVAYSNYVRNGLYPVYDPVAGGPVTPGAPIIVDPSGSASFRERSEVLSGNLGLGFTLSPRDTINFGARATRLRFPDGIGLANDYDSYGANANYMRAIGANTSVGVGFDVSKSDYLSPALGNTTQYTPTARLSTRLAPRWNLEVSAGVTFSETRFPLGTLSRTSLSTTADLCREGDRTSFCVSGSHGVSPSSIGGSSRVTSIGARYNYTIDQRSTVNASASYARSTALFNVGSFNTDYAQASIGYDRLIRPRLSAVASVTYSDTYDSFVARSANVHGLVGLKYRFGQN